MTNSLIEYFGLVIVFSFLSLLAFVMSIFLICQCFVPIIKLILHKLNLIQFNSDFKKSFKFGDNRVLEPGETESYDFRNVRAKYTGDVIRIASYNIEDGKDIIGVLEDLKKIDPDIILLQEVDVFTSRVHLDTGREIAFHMNMNCTVTCTKLVKPGYQGNAVLSKFDFFCEDSIRYTCGIKENIFKKRHCFHSSPAPLIHIVDKTYMQPISIHLDAIYAGRKNRIRQIKDVLKETELQKLKHTESQESDVSSLIQIIGGDFNTISTGIGRFCYLISPDWQSMFGDFFRTEAQVMNDKVISKSGFLDPWKKNSWLSLFNKSSEDCTMNVYGLFAGKVDWILLPTKIENDYEINLKKKGILSGSSDHKLIWIDIEIEVNE